MKRLACFVLIIAGTFCAIGQSLLDEHPLAAIPSESRHTVRALISKMVGLQRRHDWNGVYDLLYAPGSTRTEFIAERTKDKRNDVSSLIDFTPKSSTSAGNSEWLVWGCTGMKFRGKRRDAASTMRVRLVEGRWYITPVTAQISVDAPDQIAPCSWIPLYTREPKR